MKCPKCRYVSHDYLDACRKCSTDLVDFKRKFKLMVLKPGDLDLGVLVDVAGEDVSGRDRFSVEDATPDTPPRKFYMGLDELTAAPEIDIQFDPDTPSTSPKPGELTKTFYIPEVLAKQKPDVNLPDREVGLDELTAAPEIDIQFDPDTPNTSPKPRGLTKMFYVGLDELTAETDVDTQSATNQPEPLAEKTTDLGAADPDGTVPLSSSESSAQHVQHPSVYTSDMSVGGVDARVDEFEDLQLDTSEIDHDIDFIRHLPSTANIDAAEKEIEESTDNELGPKLEGTDNMPSPSEERNAEQRRTG